MLGRMVRLQGCLVVVMSLSLCPSVVLHQVPPLTPLLLLLLYSPLFLTLPLTRSKSA